MTNVQKRRDTLKKKQYKLKNRWSKLYYGYRAREMTTLDMQDEENMAFKSDPEAPERKHRGYYVSFLCVINSGLIPRSAYVSTTRVHFWAEPMSTGALP